RRCKRRDQRDRAFRADIQHRIHDGNVADALGHYSTRADETADHVELRLREPRGGGRRTLQDRFVTGTSEDGVEWYGSQTQKLVPGTQELKLASEQFIRRAGVDIPEANARDDELRRPAEVKHAAAKTNVAAMRPERRRKNGLHLRAG